MFEYLTRMFSPGQDSAAQDLPKERIQAAVEQVIDGTDPRLRMVSGYQTRLSGPAATALNHVDQIVRQLAGPRPFGRRAFGADPHLHAFFASAQELNETVHTNRALREFASYGQNAEQQSCIALLTMERHEKTVFGTALDGEMLRRDIRQTAVNFSGHRLVTPSADEERTRLKLKERAFNGLVELALEALTELRARKEDLEDQARLLRAKLGLLGKTRKFGLDSEIAAEALSDTDLLEARTRLSRIEEQLKRATANPLTLDDHIQRIGAVLENARDLLLLRDIRLSVTRMGLKAEGAVQGRVDTLDLQEVTFGQRLRRTITLVSLEDDAMETLRSGEPDGLFGDWRSES